MKINLELLKSKTTNQSILKWFEQCYPDQEPDYQAALDAAVEAEEVNLARSLLKAIGPTNDVLKIKGDLVIKTSLVFAGSIDVTGGIVAGDGIEAGWGIKAGESIKAGDGIEAGWGIKAGDDIEAGGGFGIFAGKNVKIICWDVDAQVVAKTKPLNLISGVFKAKEG